MLKPLPNDDTSRQGASTAFLIGNEKKNWLIEPYYFIFCLTFMLLPMRKAALAGRIGSRGERTEVVPRPFCRQTQEAGYLAGTGRSWGNGCSETRSGKNKQLRLDLPLLPHNKSLPLLPCLLLMIDELFVEL
jgi:hypothetical protein